MQGLCWAGLCVRPRTRIGVRAMVALPCCFFMSTALSLRSVWAQVEPDAGTGAAHADVPTEEESAPVAESGSAPAPVGAPSSQEAKEPKSPTSNGTASLPLRSLSKNSSAKSLQSKTKKSSNEPAAGALSAEVLALMAQGEVVEIVAQPPAESASSVHFTAAELARRPHSTPSDLLRQTPGLMVSQHAGGGKADQLFLRGFDADHGTDVALFVGGVPVNLTSHGHGQGYADTHWIIPETISSIDVHKGPYSARYGDFYTAGAIEMKTIDEVDGLRVSLSRGSELSGPAAFEDPTSRVVVVGSPKLGAGKSVVATELSYTDGPFENEQNFRRGLVFGKWTGPAGGGELTVTTNAYAASWNQSGQIPQRAVEAGVLGRFGAVDPTEGGTTSRNSLALAWEAPDGRDGVFALKGYVVDYRFRLYSNFTLFARDPNNGDQIEQTDSRTLAGFSGFYSRTHKWRGVTGFLSGGVQLRADNIDADLWHTRRRDRLADCFDQGQNPCNQVASRVRNIGAYVEDDLYVTDWLHIIPGLRFDIFTWDVEDRDLETTLSGASPGGTAQRAMANPKLSVIMQPTETVELFVNGGGGFHSNDARAAVADAGKGALARALGAEAGARYRPMEGLRASVAAWYLHLASEQVWSGDNGGTEPSDPSHRRGVDFDVAWQARPWLSLDANLALARSTLVANQGNSGALALAPRILGGGGATVHSTKSSVSLRARGVGDRPANSDGSLTAKGFFIFDLVASHTIGPWGLGLTVQNLFNSDWREAQFAEESRLRGEAAAVEDVHFTPGTPLVALGTLQYTY